MATFPDQVKELRKVTGWSQGELAQQLGYRQYQAVSAWERGHKEPADDVKNRVASMLETQRRLNSRAVAEEELLRGDIQAMLRFLSVDDLRQLHAPIMKRAQQRMAEQTRGLEDGGSFAFTDRSPESPEGDAPANAKPRIGHVH